MRFFSVMIFLVFPILCLEVYSSTVYRYKDDKGRWQFTDKKPKQIHELLDIKTQKKDKNAPKLYLLKGSEGLILMANNPLFAPVVFDFISSDKLSVRWVVEANYKGPVIDTNGNKPKITSKEFRYKYIVGRVIKKSDGQPLRPPIPGVGKFKVTQGFYGVFSHNKAPNQYAVDIGMKISDQVHAAREGIVVTVKDDYHMGGTSKFFLDKANKIIILHSDDTFGVYAHILLGSALVKPGDKVQEGDPLANAGTSGYSTGPHLHFTLWYNNGKERVSSPFEFKHANGIGQPKYKQWLQVMPDQ